MVKEKIWDPTTSKWVQTAPTMEEFTTHQAESMPHQFVDGSKTYRWGFRLLSGQPQFIYEEVI